MKKQNLNEQISRIKKMMGLNESEMERPTGEDFWKKEHEHYMKYHYKDSKDDGDDDEESLCSHCNGSGEGMYDGSTCRSCGGSGVEERDRDYDDYDGPDDDYDPSDSDAMEWGGMDI